MRHIPLTLAGLAVLWAGCGTGPEGATAPSSAAATGEASSLTVICPEVSKIMGTVPANPSRRQAAAIAGQLEELSADGDTPAQAALQPMIDGMRYAAKNGYSADEFRPAAIRFASACRAASQPPTPG